MNDEQVQKSGSILKILLGLCCIYLTSKSKSTDEIIIPILLIVTAYNFIDVHI